MIDHNDTIEISRIRWHRKWRTKRAMSYGWLWYYNKGTVTIFENESVPRTHNHFSVHKIPGTISVSDDFVFFSDKIYLVLPLGFVMFLWPPPPSLPHWQLIIPPLLYTPSETIDPPFIPPENYVILQNPPHPTPPTLLPSSQGNKQRLVPQNSERLQRKRCKYLLRFPYTQSLPPSSDPSGVVCGPKY